MQAPGSAKARERPKRSSSEIAGTRAVPGAISPATTRAGIPRRAAASSDAADDLPVERGPVELPFAGDDEIHSVERTLELELGRRRARSPGRARLRARRGRPRARRLLPRRGSSSRRSRARRCSAGRARAAALRGLAPARGLAPFCGANTAAASRNGVRTSQATRTRASNGRHPSASIAPSPPSVRRRAAECRRSPPSLRPRAPLRSARRCRASSLRPARYPRLRPPARAPKPAPPR